MALRDKLKQTNCFKVITIPEWDTGGEVISVRALTIDESDEIEAIRPAEVDDDKIKQAKFILTLFCYMLGDSAGNRVYKEASDSDFKEIKSFIPGKVITEVIRQAGEFGIESTKKN